MLKLASKSWRCARGGKVAGAWVGSRGGVGWGGVGEFNPKKARGREARHCCTKEARWGLVCELRNSSRVGEGLLEQGGEAGEGADLRGLAGWV
jgi:hypothetical protein